MGLCLWGAVASGSGENSPLGGSDTGPWGLPNMFSLQGVHPKLWGCPTPSLPRSPERPAAEMTPSLGKGEHPRSRPASVYPRVTSLPQSRPVSERRGFQSPEASSRGDAGEMVSEPSNK